MHAVATTFPLRILFTVLQFYVIIRCLSQCVVFRFMTVLSHAPSNSDFDEIW